MMRFAQETCSLVRGDTVWSDPGLYSYRFSSNGIAWRLHLRVERDGSGILFVDVSEAIRLSPTAALIAKLVLDGENVQAISSHICRRFRGVSREQVSRECRHIADIVASLTTPDIAVTTSVHFCRACALREQSLATTADSAFPSSVAAPFKADLALTYRCNNRCTHCYNEAERVGLQSLPLEAWKEVINKLVTVGVPHIILTGGEPTLHPDILDIIRHADASGPIVGLNTNGRRLSDSSYTQALEASGLNHVQITLESCKPHVHNTMVGADAWEQTVKGITNSLQTRMHTLTNTTLTRRNADHVEDTIQFLHDIGVRTFAVNGMIHAGGGRAHPDAIPEMELPPILARVRDKAEYLEMEFLWYTPTQYCRMSPVELEIGAKRCNAAEFSICIEPNGDVLPCQSYYVSAGNILCDPWDSIWNSELFHRLRNRFRLPHECGLPQRCWLCPDLRVCGGGCPLARDAHEQTMMNAEPMHKDRSLCSSVPEGFMECR